METEVSLTNHGKFSLDFLIYPQLGHEIENEKIKKVSAPCGEKRRAEIGVLPQSGHQLLGFALLFFSARDQTQVPRY